MNHVQAVTVIGCVFLGVLAFACSSEVPIGEGLGQSAGALGAAGQAPKADGTCDPRLSVCGSTCRDLLSDVANCGTCGNACAAGDACSSGACVPPAPPPPPPPPPVDAGSDATPPTDASTSCPFGQAFCGGACIDILFDSNNCGGCNNKCGAGTKCIRETCM